MAARARLIKRCERSECCCPNCFPLPFFSHLFAIDNSHFSLFTLHVSCMTLPTTHSSPRRDFTSKPFAYGDDEAASPFILLAYHPNALFSRPPSSTANIRGPSEKPHSHSFNPIAGRMVAFDDFHLSALCVFFSLLRSVDLFYTLSKCRPKTPG